MTTRLQPLAMLAVAYAASFLGCTDIVRANTPIPTPPPVHGRGPYGHGSGIILVDVESKTGKVMALRMLVSTGYAEFDSAALKAFRKARFKPGTAPRLRIPITFTIKGKKL